MSELMKIIDQNLNVTNKFIVNDTLETLVAKT